MAPATARISVTDPEQQAAAAARLSQPSSQWSDQLGQAAIRCSGHSIDSLSGEAGLLLPLPLSLMEQPQELIFTQWGVHRKQQTTTLNAGIGYRWFDKSQGYWGTNLFYDRQFHSAYSRWGIGIEQYYRNSRIVLNSYFPIQPQLTTLNKTTAYAAPALGIDLRCQYQIPTLPHWRVNLQAERYWGDIIVSKGKTVENHTAMTLGLDYTPIPLITAGYGFRYDNAQQKSHQLHLQLNYRFGVPASQQLNPQQVANQLLNPECLALVQRNPQIVLKQIVPKQIVPKQDLLNQKPKALMELELPSQIVGAPGTIQTISFKLTTPHPHDQWRFTVVTSIFDIFHHGGDLYLEGENKIVVMLPTLLGRYPVRLTATNQRGVSVTSNIMVIHVKYDQPGSYHKNYANDNQNGSSHKNVNSKGSSELLWKKTSKPDQRMKYIANSQEKIEALENACAYINLPCSPETLKDATYKEPFRKLLMVYHEDKNRDATVEEKRQLNNITQEIIQHRGVLLSNSALYPVTQ